MSPISAGHVLKRGWMPLVAVVVVAVSGFAVYRLQGIFGSPDDSPANEMPNAIVAFRPKHVTLEVFGVPGAVATINYLDGDSQPRQVHDAPLPWAYTITTTQPAVFANLVAQGDGDVIGCRITADGVVKDERIVNQVHAYTFCLDKSS